MATFELESSAQLSEGELAALVEDVLAGRGAEGAEEAVEAAGMAALPALADLLSRDLPIEQIEAVESRLKRALLGLMRGEPSGERARELARFQRDLGLLIKYKSYGIKASSPLGYSLFVLTPGEGFSFQRHRSHKTEIFHILAVSSDARVFLCSSEQWRDCFEPAAFASWLAGRADPRYDTFSLVPRPGDVIVIDTTDVVHSVTGCVLEEFASVSTDMVDRLFDQNLGRPVPLAGGRATVKERLLALDAEPLRRRIRPGTSGPAIEDLAQDPAPVSQRAWFGSTPSFSAAHWRIDPGQETPLESCGRQAISLYALQGQGDLLLVDETELGQPAIPRLDLHRGDSLMIPPGCHYQLRNRGTEPLVVSEHRIEPAVALG
ncbi:MAG TPA: cupin domain-containing protein [Thermoanaerobaculia bacterium]|nr:cupin domain-containing protein [Thermoanaerobaculia bacterium]